MNFPSIVTRTRSPLETGQIGDGKGAFEQPWLMRAAGHEILLEIFGTHGRTCYLTQSPNGTWRGQVVLHPFPMVEVIPS